MKRITELRKLLRLTQAQLAQMVGISITWMYYIENDYVKPSPEIKQKLARALGVRVEDIWPPETKELAEKT